MAKRHNNKLMEKLAAQESGFLNSEFLSPVIRNQPIQVRIASIVMSMKVTEPKDFEGWGVFKPTTFKTAAFVREPSWGERAQYFKLFPTIRLVLCRHKNKQWFGIPANHADNRFKLKGLVPVQMPEEVQMFETVCCRFDGNNCWFEEVDSRANPKTAPDLRDALGKFTENKDVVSTSLKKEDLAAYNIALLDAIEANKDWDEERIKQAIVRAGAQYRSYVERGGSYTVEYVVDGQVHKSVVNKDTLEVQSAGICLNGTDSNFDLQSLVTVIREGINGRQIVRVGLNTNNHYDHDDDW